MSKIKDEIETQKDLINQELDYFYNKEQELMRNLNDVIELRQDLLNGIKEDLKKLADVYKVKEDEVPVEVDTELCKNCTIPCANLYCDECQHQLEQDPNYFD